jgi:Family of unknown function (DUF6318)
MVDLANLDRLSTGLARAVPMFLLIWHDSGVRIRFAVIVGILAMLVAGCDGGGHSSGPSDSARASGPPSTATSSRPSPTRTGPLTTGPNVQAGEKPPVLSDDAKQHTPAGALLFATYCFQAFDWSVATNDPYLVSKISAPSCAACQRVIEGIAALGKEGARIQGGRIHLESSKIVSGPFRFKSDYVAQVTLMQGAEVIARPSSAPSTAARRTKDVSLVFISWVSGAWQVKEVGAPS